MRLVTVKVILCLNLYNNELLSAPLLQSSNAAGKKLSKVNNFFVGSLPGVFVINFDNVATLQVQYTNSP